MLVEWAPFARGNRSYVTRYLYGYLYHVFMVHSPLFLLDFLTLSQMTLVFFAWSATAYQVSPCMVERHIIPYEYKPRYLPAMPTAQRMHKHDNAQVVVISIATGVPKNTCGYLSCKGPIIHGKIIAEHAG